MKLVAVVDGAKFLVLIAAPDSGPSPLASYEALDITTRANVLHTMTVLANQGYVPNDERFKQIEETDLHEIKKHRHRFVGFFLPDRRFVVGSYEEKKKNGKLREQTLERARRIRAECLALREKKEPRHARRDLAGTRTSRS